MQVQVQMSPPAVESRAHVTGGEANRQVLSKWGMRRTQARRGRGSGSEFIRVQDHSASQSTLPAAQRAGSARFCKACKSGKS